MPPRFQRRLPVVSRAVEADYYRQVSQPKPITPPTKREVRERLRREREAAMLADLRAGMTVKQVAEKYRASDSTVAPLRAEITG